MYLFRNNRIWLGLTSLFAISTLYLFMTSAVINNTKKIGIIDNELVLQNYKGVIENSKILETKKNRLLGELQSYRVEIQDHVKQIEQESDQARKEKLIKVFQLKNKDYEKRKSQVEQEIQAEAQ